MVEKASFFKPLVGKGKLVKDSTVTVIVSTKNAARILAHTLPVMHEHDQVAEIIIVSNQTDNPYSLALLERLGKLEKISIIYYNENFNFSKQSNIAAEASKSKNLVFFNDDVIPAEDDWLDQLLVGFLREKRAIVGPLLLYPDGTVQHGGLGVTKGGNVEHRYRGGSFPIDSYNYDLIFPSRVWALTGAVLLTSRELFQELGGFDESLATGWQDVDLCLRAREIGAEIIFEPRVIMTHLESVSISQELEGGAGKISHSQRTDERLLFIDRWGPFANSSYSPRISPEDPSCRTLKVAY
ncbi:MAG: GT2 family glycosyltransferase [Candidatus Azotimanducaceae bacterium]|jgi:GT2 family glycosyltransferase